MRGYAIIRKDGSFVRGELPEGIDVEKFCIMCATAFWAGHASQGEMDSGANRVIIAGEEENLVIGRLGEHLFVVIGQEEDAEKFLRENEERNN